MKEFYITSTRTYYPEQGDVEVHLHGRAPNGVAEHVRVQGFDPYFYVSIDQKDLLQPKEHSGLKRVEAPADTPSLFGDEMAKVVATHPGAIRQLREQYDDPFEADVLFTNRLRIDEDIYTGIRAPRATVTSDEIEPVNVDAEPRYLYYDIEIDDQLTFPIQGDEMLHTDSEIATLVGYDNYDEEYHGFINLDGRALDEVLPDVVATGEAPGCIDTLHYFESEKLMLKEWFSYVSRTNPDVLLAWNQLGFDAPYLIERAKSLGLDPASMGRGPDPEASYNSYGPELTGRVLYDLMKAWSRMQYSQVSAALDNAAEMELGDEAGKISHEASIREMWEDDAAGLLEYNGRDVSLMVDINDSAAIMQDREELKDTVGVDYEETYESNDFIEMLVRRKLDEWGVCAPTKSPPTGNDDYEGAYTFPAYSGRASNVTSMDVASLYPFTMQMLNASPETLVTVADDPQEYLETHDHDFEVAAAPNGAIFRQDEDGLFRALVDEALELTQQAGRRRDQHPTGSAEWKRWNQTREARKRIRNGLYGVLGWVWHFLYDRTVAESVTTMAQEVIKTSATYVNEEREGEVIYGDTDSCYISWPDEWTMDECLLETNEVVNQLNEHRYPELAASWGMDADNCKWDMEMESGASTFFQAGKKKRYAARIVWKEGMEFGDRLDDAPVKIMGFEVKRSDAAELLNRVQQDVLTLIVEDAPKSDIRERLFQAAQQITRRDPDWNLIGIPGGIGQDLDEYDSDTAQVRAAKAANSLFDAGLGKGDKPMRVYLEEKTIDHNGASERTDVIGYTDASDIEPVANQLYVDVARMQDVILKRPMARIMEPIGIDVDAAMTGATQKAVSDFL